jgi:apolipoprotein N-acyltransferase
MDYIATDKHKTMLSRSSYRNIQTRAWALRWANTGAVNSVIVDADGSSLAAGSTLDLYGRIA